MWVYFLIVVRSYLKPVKVEHSSNPPPNDEWNSTFGYFYNYMSDLKSSIFDNCYNYMSGVKSSIFDNCYDYLSGLKSWLLSFFCKDIYITF